MAFSPLLAELRFGTGRGPGLAAPRNRGAMLAALRGPDEMARRFPMGTYAERFGDVREWSRLRRARNDSDADKRAFRLFNRGLTARGYGDLGRQIARGAETTDGFRERLAWFWADHFTVTARRQHLIQTIPAYIDEAIRPNMTGRMADLLIAVVMHPAMLSYLDQNASIGPNSPRGSQGDGRGLNENLAREILELHTLGVGGAYGQTDVRQLAELLTGLSVDRAGAMAFRPRFVEPGAEEILGETYGGRGGLAPIRAALGAICDHPDTVRHVCRKLAIHFLADAPPEAVVADMIAAWGATGGQLMAVYDAMLAHPMSWAVPLRKVRRPLDYVVAAARALGVGAQAPEAGIRVLRDTVRAPMALMGQAWMQAPGPDGWPEASEAWITPQALAARIDWAMKVPGQWRDSLPDPRVFLEETLGDLASERLRFAAAGAETRAAGIGLILASPEFQRR